jgi:hypothetical protein
MSFETSTARPSRVRIPATSGDAALVPTTAPQPPAVEQYSLMPPALLAPLAGVNSAAAAMSLVARDACERDGLVAEVDARDSGAAPGQTQRMERGPYWTLLNLDFASVA